MAEEVFVFGVLDQRAVVVDLVGVELEVVVDLQDGAWRPRGGDDDLDPAAADLGDGLDGFDAQAFVAGQQRAVEVQRDQVDPPGADAFIAAAALAARGRLALAGLGLDQVACGAPWLLLVEPEFVVEVELFRRNDGAPCWSPA